MSETPKYTCIIPARYESSRFPGKPLAKIFDKAMIDWVYKHASESKYTGKVIIATDSEEIFNYCKENGMEVAMTGEHRNGAERIAEVAKDLDDEYVFEMQGDQPALTPDRVDDFLMRAHELVSKNSEIDVVHPFTPATEDQVKSPDVVKVFASDSGRLLFQSRQPIPTGLRTLGLYLWKNKSVQKFWSLDKAPIEIIEDTHPVRLYYYDFYVQGLEIDGNDWIEVDRPHQIEEVEKLMKDKGII